MNGGWRSAGLALLLAALPGCASLRGLFDPPARLLEQARAAIERQDLDTAYRDLAEIGKRYPDSPESREAFGFAAAVLQVRYFRDRYAQPGSPWVTTEPRFMLDWLFNFLDAPENPEPEATALFVGMPYGYFRDYLALAAARPAPPRFALSAEDDNGIIETVTVTAASP